jgi:hypothetical protein
MFLVLAIDELQYLRSFESGDAYNDVLKPLKTPRFLEKKLIELKSKAFGYFVRLHTTLKYDSVFTSGG